MVKYKKKKNIKWLENNGFKGYKSLALSKLRNMEM